MLCLKLSTVRESTNVLKYLIERIILFVGKDVGIRIQRSKTQSSSVSICCVFEQNTICIASVNSVPNGSTLMKDVSQSSGCFKENSTSNLKKNKKNDI